MRNTTCACGSACIVHDAARTSQHPTPNDATSDASGAARSDGGAVLISARLADYGRLADRLAVLATSAYIVTRRHPDDINAAALLRELLALALDAHRASCVQNLRFVDLRGREVDAADWHDLERMRDTSEALRHILARLTQMTYPEPLTLASDASAPASSARAACECNERTHIPQAPTEATPEAQQTARKRRMTVSPAATPDALLASSGAATQHRKGHTHA